MFVVYFGVGYGLFCFVVTRYGLWGYVGIRLCLFLWGFGVVGCGLLVALGLFGVCLGLLRFGGVCLVGFVVGRCVVLGFGSVVGVLGFVGVWWWFLYVIWVLVVSFGLLGCGGC